MGNFSRPPSPSRPKATEHAGSVPTPSQEAPPFSGPAPSVLAHAQSPLLSWLCANYGSMCHGLEDQTLQSPQLRSAGASSQVLGTEAHCQGTGKWGSSEARLTLFSFPLPKLLLMSETESHSVALELTLQARLASNPQIYLSLPPVCWGYRCVPHLPLIVFPYSSEYVWPCSRYVVVHAKVRGQLGSWGQNANRQVR